VDVHRSHPQVAPHERLQQTKFALQGVEAASILFIHGASTCPKMIKNAFCSSLSQAGATHSTPPRPCCVVFRRGVKLENKNATQMQCL
jgi:hypothetical protein